jgi:ATP-dependent helicase/nuclease subunit A
VIADPAARSPLGLAAGARSTGFKRGLIVHRLLQILPDLPGEQRRTAAVRFLARPVHELPPEEQAAIAAETLAILEDPAFAALFGPQSQAEVPLVGLIGGFAVSGQIDRLLVAPDEVTIVDYKTLRPPPADEADVPVAYLRQLAVYRAAIAQIYPGRRVRAALVWTDGPRLMPLSAERLAQFGPAPGAALLS